MGSTPEATQGRRVFRERLQLTRNAQPALMATSLAAFRALESEGLSLDAAAFVAGHSLGEYSALCAAGAIGLSDTARLLRLRGEAMQAAVPVGQGAMAALLGLDFIKRRRQRLSCRHVVASTQDHVRRVPG